VGGQAFVTPETSASPAGLTARARPKVRPETRAAMASRTSAAVWTGAGMRQRHAASSYRGDQQRGGPAAADRTRTRYLSLVVCLSAKSDSR